MPPDIKSKELTHEYRKIPLDKVDEHISKVRDLASIVYPYPSTKIVRFLDLRVPGDHLLPSGLISPANSEAVQ